MVKSLIDSKRTDLEKALERFKEDLNQLRTGRASTSLVDSLMVDYYGSKSPIKQVASITTPDPKTIMIAPWDKDNLVNIEKAIRESQLNLNPMNDGQVIRINIPPLNEERRKELVKVLNQKAEEARVAVRKNREAVWDEIQELERKGQSERMTNFPEKKDCKK